MRRPVVVMVLALAALLAAGAAPAAATPGDPYAPQYYFDTWDVAQLWASGARGQGITIGEIDTGVDAGQRIFAGRVLRGTDFGRLGGDGRVDRDKDPYGHGTSMASIMVGRPGRFGIRGLAPRAKLLPVAIPLAGTTDAAPDDHLAAAIRWAADHGANIISMSLGGVRRPADNRSACPDDEQQAIYHALRKGAVVLAAAGNRGDDDNAIEEPGVCLGVVSVGAVDSSGAVAAFSSRQRYLTMTAPGVDIASVGHDGAPFSGDGTSQATAVASAAAALVWSKEPTLTGPQLVTRLLATVTHRSARHDNAYGYGTIDPARAIRSSAPADAANPVYEVAGPFLAHSAATERPRPAPPPAAAHASGPPGSFSVGSAPRLLTPRVLTGSGVALAGLLALGALLALAVRGRRRAAPAPGPFGPDADAELDWHDIRREGRAVE